MGKYLGFPLLTKRVSMKEFTLIIEKILARLVGWKGCLLNKLGRIMLARSALSAIPTYTMQTMWFSSSTFEAINASNIKFTWRENPNKAKGWNLLAHDYLA